MRHPPAPVHGLVLAALLGGCSCGTPEIRLTISAPSQVQLAKGASAVITVAATYDGDPLMDGEAITLETSLGTLVDANATCTQGCEGAASVSLMSLGGRVRATLRPASDSTPGTAVIVAKYLDPYAVEHVATVSVVFLAARVSSLQFYCNIGGQRMVVGSIGAYIQRGEEIQVPCKAAGWDEDNHWVDSAKVKFLTEAGGFVTMTDPPDPDELGQMFLYRPRAGGKFPRDVDALGDAATGEPRYYDPVTHSTRNPRDGLATLVAYVPGDPLPGFEGEPYVDENDNNQYDTGEEYADLNKNTQWDDEQTEVQWKQIKILWTGELCIQDLNHACPATKLVQVFEGSGQITSLARGDSVQYKVVFLDANLNVPSWNLVSDGFTVPETTPADPELGTTCCLALVRDSIGIDVELGSSRLRYPSKAESYGIGSTYLLSFKNNRATGEEFPAVELLATIQLSHTYTLDESGTGGSTLDESISAHTGVIVQ